MSVFKPQFSKKLAGLGFGWLALMWGLAASVAVASPLFAGVSGIEAGKAAAGNVQPIHFQSDLPFQYQMQVLDADHIVLRLYNARLADTLLTPEGGVNLLSGGSVESAALRLFENNALPNAEYQEIILTGAGLGQKTLRVTGATEMPLTQALTIKKVPPQAVNRVAVSKPASSLTAGLPNLASLQRPAQGEKSTKKAFQKLVNEPLAMMALVNDAASPEPASDLKPLVPPAQNNTPASPKIVAGPSIASVSNVTNVASARPAQAPRVPVVETPDYLPPSYLPVKNQAQTTPLQAIQSQAVGATPVAAPVTEPEPSYQVLTPLPRYKGGAAPIQAMTIDREGRTVVVRPKNQPITDFSIGTETAGYNTLFQAEPETEQQQVGRLMADALDAYKQKQFDQALARIQQALRIDSKNSDLYAALAEIQIQLKQPAKAVAAYQKATEQSQEKYGQRYAQVLVLAGQRDQALLVLKKLYQQNNKQVQVAYMLGTLYEEQGQTQEALPYLKQAAALHPASADIQYNLGLAYELSGDRLQAEKHYRQALNLNASATDASKALARVRAE